MFSLRFTIVLGLLLAIPFFLRLKGMEPYPAILLPEGAATSPDVTLTVLYGRTTSGALVMLDQGDFYFPIPVQYVAPILTRFSHFYMPNTADPKTKLLQKLGFADRYRLTTEDLHRANGWFQERLKARQFDTTQVTLITYRQVLASVGNTKPGKTIVNEQTIFFN